MSAPPITGMAFGLEFELVVIPPSRAQNGPALPLTAEEICDAVPNLSSEKNRQRTVQDLRENHYPKIAPAESEKGQIGDMIVNWNNDNQEGKAFKTWQITYDSSVGPRKSGTPVIDYGISGWRNYVDCAAAKYGLEIISPVMRTDFTKPNHELMKENISSLYNFLRSTGCQVESNYSCSTHVHVSCKGASKWSWEDARRVALASFFWQRVIDLVIGDERAKGLTSARYCRKYPTRPEHKDASWETKWKYWVEAVYATKTLKDLIVLVNPNPNPQSQEPEFDRYYRWNFTNLLLLGSDEPNKLAERKIGTIEFRGPPGSPTAEDALKWADFATHFVWAATEKGSRDYFQKTLGGAKFYKNKPQAVWNEFLKFIDLPETLFPEANTAVAENEAAMNALPSLEGQTVQSLVPQQIEVAVEQKAI
ncbi:hypothetical protein EKO27_g5666 [Xylaria grammica]|uniref:Amidoligase enzyme n=1 Tax=Xylaria grammica TaxID=363999 RepID=A0A439D4X2_9PEZI|nr:hypothetical protein EKO27_g5666 [Xylaria grammica]